MAAVSRKRTPASKAKVLAAVRPNAGIEAAYRRKIDALVTEMHESVLYWLTAAYRANEPEMAADASPAETLRRIFARLTKRWKRKFDDMAPKLAAYFCKSVMDRADGALAATLKEAGWTVPMKLTAPINDVLRAGINENVSLIRSIGREHLADVEQLVMRSVAAGRDLGGLTKDLEARYGITRRRAALIARTENNKGTALITRARQADLGIREAIWCHSSAGREPRPSHVAMNGKTYDISKGAYLDGEWVFPGTAINCRCTSRSVIPGFNSLKQ